MVKPLALFILSAQLCLPTASPAQKKMFPPDSTISKRFRLQNVASVLDNVDQAPALAIEGDYRTLTYANIRGDEYLQMIQHPGSRDYSFGTFVVGVLPPADTTKERLPFDSFFTDNGISLGMARKDLLRRKGEPSSTIDQHGEVQLIYELQNDAFLARYRQTGYSEEFVFVEGKLVRFRFGFK